MATGYEIIGGSTTVPINITTAEFTVNANEGPFDINTNFYLAVEIGAVVEFFGANIDYQDDSNGNWNVFTLDGTVSAFTFTVRWPTAGTKTIIYTNDKGFSNPSNGSVLVTAVNSMRGNSLSAMR